MSGKLYIVSTPIGNLEDITLRAIRVLNEANLILCEDTRVTRRLLAHYEIKTPTESFHAHSTRSKMAKIISALEGGKDIALVTDAGTPGVSDPGADLVREVRKELPEVKTVPIPGPSALTTLISVSGLRQSDFVFTGFFPHKKGRESLVKEIIASDRPYVFYESAHRIEKTLALFAKFGAGGRELVVGRELTKIFEEVVTGSFESVAKYFKDHPDKVRGEFVLAVLTRGKVY
jgi:16S rRNA (cytidine1402-2'-O)-methyltransferase